MMSTKTQETAVQSIAAKATGVKSCGDPSQLMGRRAISMIIIHVHNCGCRPVGSQGLIRAWVNSAHRSRKTTPTPKSWKSIKTEQTVRIHSPTAFAPVKSEWLRNCQFQNEMCFLDKFTNCRKWIAYVFLKFRPFFFHHDPTFGQINTCVCWYDAAQHYQYKSSPACFWSF